MILIADSGSTKTDWRIIDAKGQVHQAKTGGINPYYQSEQEISEELLQTLQPQVSTDIKEIHFYGAGCNNEEKNQVVARSLSGLYGNAQISVNSDLLAVARALCGKDPGIACILGTGSNSCHYDGKDIVQHIPPWGTWLGDEGSGSVMGRNLIVLYLNKELPKHLQDAFSKRYPDVLETVMDKVYRASYPNRYLGQFSRFLYHHMKDPFVYEFVYQNFQQFFKRKVLKYESAAQLPVHFSGSIGFYFNTILRKAASDLNLQIKNVVENPIAGLTLFHKP